MEKKSTIKTALTMASGSENGFAFGQTYFVYPIGIHKATIVWLHDIGCTGLESMKELENLRLPNIKWICPTAPKRVLSSSVGSKTAWFNVNTHISESMKDDIGTLNYVNTYVATLLSSEPVHVMKGVGGVGIGAAQALFYASAYVIGRIPINLKMVIGINGWLLYMTNLQSHMKAASGSSEHAASVKILVAHANSDNTVPSTVINRCVNSLREVGFPITLKECKRAHVTNEIHIWLTTMFGLGN